MNKSERLQVALPKGELQKDVCAFMNGIGIEVTPPNKADKRLIRPSTNFPIDIFWLRASEVAKRVADKRTQELTVGITGSDCALEAGTEPSAEIPIAEFVPDPITSRLFLGITREFLSYMQREGLGIEALKGSTVGTKLMRIAGRYFYQRRLDVNLEYTAGSDELMPKLYPDCYSIFGVISSGDSARVHNIIPVDDNIHNVFTCLVTNPTQMTPGQEVILDDFRDKIAIAQERRRMI